MPAVAVPENPASCNPDVGFILLQLAGDIESNPGPSGKEQSILVQ